MNMTPSPRSAPSDPLRIAARTALCVAALAGLLSCGGGGGDAGPPERPEGVYTGFSATGDLDWTLASGGDSAGGVGGGGDGDGGVGAGGDFGQFRNARVLVKYPDGSPVGNGEALTDAATGMVTIKVRKGYQGPLFLELRGGANASYYEEGKDAFVPFPEGQVIRTWVPKIDKNIGITPFTETAYRLLTEGSTAERASSGIPTAAEITAANAKVLALLNQQFPAVLKVDDITRLPFIKSPSVQPGQITTNPRGIYGLVNGAFSKQAAMFNPGTSAPTLAAIRQLGEDVLDGRLDGLRGTQPAVPAGNRTYDPNTLTGELTSALAEQSARFGTQDAIGLLPKIINFGNSRYSGYLFDASLRPGGEAITTVAGWVAEDKENRPLGSDRGRKIPGRVFSVYANMGHGGVFLKANAVDSQSKLFGLGDNIAGELGDGTTGVGTRANVGTAVEIPLPTTAVVTHMAGGFAHTVARMADGSVYTWGDNSYSQLGQGLDRNGLVRSEVPLKVTLPLAAIAVAASNTASYALLEDGRVFSWGSSWGFGLLGDGVKDSVRNSPAAVLTGSGELSGVVQITARDNDAMVTLRDGSVWTWGSFPSDAPFGYTEGDVAGAYKGGSPFPTQITGLNLAPGVQIRKILAEQGLFVALTDDGAVYTWGVHFDITAQTILRDTAAVQVLGLPRVRDLMPGGFIGYGSRPFDRLTGMAIDYNGNLWKVRGRVAEQFDPANPTQQRRPQGQAPRVDCASCHLILTEWPLTPPAPTNPAVCQPPADIHGSGATLLLRADTPCQQCHNPARTVDRPSFTNGWLNCVRPTDLPPRSLPIAPAQITNSCSVPAGHVFTPQGTVCSSCHNSIIARPLQSLNPPCAQPQSTELPTLTTTATIASIRNDRNEVIASGGATNDTSPELQGSLSTALAPGQSLVVRRNDTLLGNATANSTSWTYADSITPNGAQSYRYTVRVEASAKAFGPTSNAYTVLIDTAAPTQAADVTGISDDANTPLPDGGFTGDTTPTVSGGLSAALAAGETVRLERNGVQIAALAANGTAWTFTEPSGLAAAAYVYRARVVDAAGNTGSYGTARTINVLTTVPTVAITAIVNDSNVTIAAGASTSDPTPTLRGTIGAALPAGYLVRVLRNGIPLAGTATVTGTTWTFTDPGPGEGAQAYTARSEAGAVLGGLSASYSIVVDTVSPTQAADVTLISDDFIGGLPAGGNTSDSTPIISGTLSAALGTGETVRLLRGGVATGVPIAAGTAWTYTEPTALTAGQYAYRAQVVDAAGNAGPLGAQLSVTISTASFPLPNAAIQNLTVNGVGPQGGAVPVSNDNTPTLAGFIQRALATGEVVKVYVNNVSTANATAAVGSTTWSYTSPTRPDGTTAFRVQVEQAANAAAFGQSLAVNVPIDTAVPTQTVNVTQIADSFSGNLANGGNTADTTPTISGTLIGTLGTGESIQLRRNGTAIGSPAPSGQTWTFTDGPLPAGSYTYDARVVDTATNGGAAGGAATVVVVTNLPTTAISSVSRDDGTTVTVSGSSISDLTPTVNGTLSSLLPAQTAVRVYRNTTGTLVGSATVNGLNWTITEGSSLGETARTYFVRTENGSALGPLSTGFAVTVDVTPPPPPSIAAYANNRPFGNYTATPGTPDPAEALIGSETSDPDSLIRTTFAGPLAAGERIVVTLASDPTRPISLGAGTTSPYTFTHTAALARPGFGLTTARPIAVSYTAIRYDAANNASQAVTVSFSVNYLACNQQRAIFRTSNTAHNTWAAGTASCTASCHTSPTATGFVAVPPAATSADRYWCIKN